eukprot:3244437-Pyramimonas_sp.AAC.1
MRKLPRRSLPRLPRHCLETRVRLCGRPKTTRSAFVGNVARVAIYRRPPPPLPPPSAISHGVRNVPPHRA